MQATWINAFCNTTIDVFKTMFQTEVNPGKPMLKTEPFVHSDISAIIGFSGDAQGSIALSFPKLTALKVVSAMLSTTIKVFDHDVSDAIGELVNIVAGNVKKDIPEFQLSISLPQVVVGMQHVLSSQTSVATIVIPFTSSMGEFTIEVGLKKKKT
jgi:chemotaxis protein CheX